MMPAAATLHPGSSPAGNPLDARFRDVRARSIALAAPISPEDAMLQSMADTSPTKWHLAHTTWFFETFVLARMPGYSAIHPDWDYLFNSYYQSVGPMHARPQRGLLSRPTLSDVLAYREQVDERVERALADGNLDQDALQVLLLGTHHEQQHQELLLTDIKHAFSINPLRPAYRADLAASAQTQDRKRAALEWIEQPARIVEIGAPAWPDAPAFAYDNESPRHRVVLESHALANRLVTNAEYRAFIEDGGYRTPALWMSEGWARVQSDPDQWSRPLYWKADLDRHFTLAGMQGIDPDAPVCHLSYFEADAFARWAGARLPTEAEWEAAAAERPVDANLLETDTLAPRRARAADSSLQQMFGDVWEWTASAYMPYPGFRALSGALGEYNGKFMCGQWILRGGSCVTPADHIRTSYRNFFYPPDRWQFSGLRLAKDT